MTERMTPTVVTRASGRHRRSTENVPTAAVNNAVAAAGATGAVGAVAVAAEGDADAAADAAAVAAGDVDAIGWPRDDTNGKRPRANHKHAVVAAVVGAEAPDCTAKTKRGGDGAATVRRTVAKWARTPKPQPEPQSAWPARSCCAVCG